MNTNIKPLTLVLVTFSLAAGSLLGGCAPKAEEHKATTTTKILTTATDKPPASVGTEISIVGTKAPFYDSPVATIEVGGRITWTHNDKTNRPHTVTGDTASFDSDNLLKNDVFSRTFDEEGEFPYHCKVHPTMKGKVIVEEAK